MTSAGAKYQFAEWEFTFVKDGVARRVVQGAVSAARPGEKQNIGVAGVVYYSAPAHYFDVTEEVYLHALNSMDFAG